MDEIIKIKIDAKPLIILGQDVVLRISDTKIPIKTKADFLKAGEVRNTVRKFIKAADEKRKVIVEPLNTHKTAIQDEFNKIIKPLSAALDELEDGMKKWETAEEKRIQKENEERIRIANEKAAADKKALEDKAKAAEKSGDVEKAQVLQEQAQEVTAAPKLKQATKAAGFSTFTTYEAEVIDFKALPDEFKEANMSLLNARAKVSGGVCSIPGVKFNAKKVASGRIQ